MYTVIRKIKPQGVLIQNPQIRNIETCYFYLTFIPIRTFEHGYNWVKRCQFIGVRFDANARIEANRQEHVDYLKNWKFWILRENLPKSAKILQKGVKKARLLKMKPFSPENEFICTFFAKTLETLQFLRQKSQNARFVYTSALLNSWK